MNLSKLEQQITRSLCHVLAVPYPGKGHVNPMMNLCKSLLLSTKRDDHKNLLITFVVTEEWLGFISDDHDSIKHSQIQFRTIPNVLPSELVRGKDFPGFYEAVMTKMEAPFEQLLDQIEPPVRLVIADTELLWAVPAANCRNISVASLWTMSASVLSMFRCFDLIQARCFQGMNLSSVERIAACHVAAIPFPGRGHINPMMNLCKFLSSKKPDILITVVVTEEWLGYIGSDAKPDNIRFAAVADAAPPERLKAVDFPAFYEAVMTKMESPVEKLLDRLQTPVTAIVADVELRWGADLGKRRNIPVALFWTMPASFFAMLHYANHFAEDNNNNPPLHLLVEDGDDKLENIPGLSSVHVADLKTVIHKTDKRVLKLALECISQASKAQYLLLTSVNELEPQAMDTLSTRFPFSVYPIGPAIPYLELDQHISLSSTSKEEHNYSQWLNSQPTGSVLYISLGSFLSVSSAQMDEIAYGLRNSSVRFLWVARSESSRLKEICGDLGFVVPWCDQLKVLCHSSIGGFWTHCGWNSTLEAVFGGVPMLTFPLFLDQFPNSRQIVEDWKTGWRVEREMGIENLMKREEIAELVKRFMDHESNEGKEMRKRARELSDVCQRAIAEGGSSDKNLDAFIRNICNTRPIGH